MNNLKLYVCTLFFLIPFSLMGCSRNANKNGTPALFDTKSEAEEAAKTFSCTGAHKMGEKWMPCKNHGSHEVIEKDLIRGETHHNHN